MSLTQVLDQKPEDVLLPNEKLNEDILKNLKGALDTVAPKYSPLDAVYVDGLKADQVWVQVQMVLDGVSEKLSSTISQYTPDSESVGVNNGDSDLSDDNDDDDEDLSGEEFDEEDFSNDDSSQAINEGIADDDSAEEAIDFNNLQDDYVDEDMSEDETKAGSKHGERDEKSLGNENDTSDREEKFDLGEFQQHVLRLEQDGSEDEGPEIDYNAEVGESSDEDDDEDMRYQDFFGSAPKKPHSEPKPKKKVQFNEDGDDLWSDEETQPSSKGTAASGDVSDSEEEAMQSARKDLFDDDDDESENLPEGEQLSKFEKQQQELSQQIAELEAENMGQKDWGMRGEAKAKDRPEDSLFSIQFDRSSKPAPAITEEATNSLEDMIKARIRKQQFDDIPRRSELATPSDLKRELPELSEQKSGKSLAELYEEDRMRSENPEYYAKQDSAVMDAAHQEIVSLYSSVARKLDALCSWAYTPKPAAPSLQVVTQGSSIAMEEAQPGTLAPEAQLAPQEVYKSQSATPMDNSEMTTSMKRKRRREKSLQKGGASSQTSSSNRDGKRSKRDNKESMFSTLKQGNVTMVDKRGDKRDMRGNKVKEGVSQTASHMKL